MSTVRIAALQRHRRLLVGALAAGALLAVAMPGDAPAAQAAVKAAANPAAVEIHNYQFVPATLTVTAGTTVTWTNNDTSPHTVTDNKRTFHSAALDTKDTFTYTFAAPGEYVYRCTFHPMMVGRVIVKAAGKSS